MDYRELRRKVDTFRLDDGDLGNQGYSRVLLQLFGYLGHGKSSFINSCKYVLNDGEPFVEHAEAGERKDGGSMTTIRKSFQLTSNITIVDNRGCIAMTTFERAEVYAQLGNFYPLDEKVVVKENFSEVLSIVENSDSKNSADFLVPIFIFSAEYHLPAHEQKNVRDFFENCDKMTGVVPIVVLTRKNSGNFLEVEKQFLLMGAEAVFYIENYTETSHVKTLGRSTDILRIIVKALENVTFRLSLPRDPEADWKARKIFLYNYIYEAKDEKTKPKETNQISEVKKEPGFFQKICKVQ